MEEKKEIALIGHYFQLVLRKRWYVIVPFCLAMAIGLAWAMRAPRVYEAKTLILVEPQAVPGDVVRPIVSRDMSSRVATISQQITSRSNLEKIIGQFQLFAKPEEQKLFIEDKLEVLRKRITVTVMRTQGASDAFSVAFRASDAEQTMKVANALSGHFIESNLQVREEQAEGTSNFLEAELESKRALMEKMESELRDFRQRHMGELPEQMQANLSILQSLERQLDERKDRIRDERNRLTVMQNQIELINQLESSLSESTLASAQTQSSIPSALQQRYEELSNLLTVYTENHPDVIRLKKKIEEMEKQIQDKAPIVAEKMEAPIGTQRTEVSPPNPLKGRMPQLVAGESDIGKLQQNVAKLEQEIRDYQK